MAEVAYLVKGNDPLLRDRVVDDLVAELLDGDDRTLALEDLTVPGRAGAGDDEEGGGGAEAREAVVAAVLNAASSPPFMTARRIVVVREAGALTAADADVIVRYLDAPLDTSVIVLVSGGGTIPAALTKKLKEVGAGERAPDSEKTSRRPGQRDARRERAAASRCAQARRRAPRRGRRSGRLVHRRAARRPTATVRRSMPTTSRRTSAKPARCPRSSSRTRSRRATARARSRCCTGCSPHRTRSEPEPMHPLQVLGTLLGYYRRLLRLDDESVQSSADAIAALGGRVKEFPARKALSAARCARYRRHPPGVRRAPPGRPRHQGRARHPAGRGGRGARGALGSPARVRVVGGAGRRRR